MKRSEINQLIREALEFLGQQNFKLPPFAHWTPEDWRKAGPEAAEIVECQLGFDLTDFGTGEYLNFGLFLFTIRNGRPQNLLTLPLRGKTYAEKIMIVRERQTTPWHFHWAKMEDIINRGGGELVIELANATPGDERLADTAVEVIMDGVKYTFPARTQVTLKPGESITLHQGLYHAFWGAPGKGLVLVGEVSQVNDDHTDNRFLQSVGRFPEIEEDEEPLRLLVGDYQKYFQC